VAQTTDEAVVRRLASWDGPGIVGLMPGNTARFVHDPAAGTALAARLVIDEIPSLDHRKRTGGFSVAQQHEELEQLRALQAAAAVAGEPAVPAAAASADPADKLAAWLLQQADLSGV
jgi:hypothetical protein